MDYLHWTLIAIIIGFCTLYGATVAGHRRKEEKDRIEKSFNSVYQVIQENENKMYDFISGLEARLSRIEEEQP